MRRRASFDEKLPGPEPKSDSTGYSFLRGRQQGLDIVAGQIKLFAFMNQVAVDGGDAVLDAVAQLEGLEWLNLYGTQVTDAGLMKLKGLGNLKKVYLWQSKATADGAKALKVELPSLEVIFGVGLTSGQKATAKPQNGLSLLGTNFALFFA